VDAPVAHAAVPTPSALPIPVVDAPDIILNPFPVPVTDAMTETVRMVLVVYERTMRIHPELAPLAIPNSGSLVHFPVILTAPTVAPPSTPTPTPKPRIRRADLAVTIWPNPSIRVARGGTLAYEIRLKNYGHANTTIAHVTLPYQSHQLRLTGSHFNRPDDWVSQVTSDRVVVTFARLESGAACTGTLFFQVNEALADNTVISMRASYEWSDDHGTRSWQTNWAPVLVGGGNDSAPWVWLAIDPVASPPGTTHHLFTDRFIPGEGIVTWLNTPSGVRPLDLRGVADLMGRVWLDFTSEDLAPGTYSLVLYGARSNLTAIVTLYVL
jgi:hypothetical protein